MVAAPDSPCLIFFLVLGWSQGWGVVGIGGEGVMAVCYVLVFFWGDLDSYNWGRGSVIIELISCAFLHVATVGWVRYGFG